jgi:hypothetical protein
LKRYWLSTSFGTGAIMHHEKSEYVINSPLPLRVLSIGPQWQSQTFNIGSLGDIQHPDYSIPPLAPKGHTHLPMISAFGPSSAGSKIFIVPTLLWSPVACNPSYSGGRDQEDLCLKPAGK